MSDKLVVHCKKSPYDVYIGRGSLWGNPFRIGQHGDRKQVILLYREYLWQCLQDGSIHLFDLADLYGKTLGCYCSPAACHGDVLVRASAWAHEVVIQLTLNDLDDMGATVH